jgi:hypothetical protein
LVIDGSQATNFSVCKTKLLSLLEHLVSALVFLLPDCHGEYGYFGSEHGPSSYWKLKWSKITYL